MDKQTDNLLKFRHSKLSGDSESEKSSDMTYSETNHFEYDTSDSDFNNYNKKSQEDEENLETNFLSSFLNIHTTSSNSLLSSEVNHNVNYRGLINCGALFLIVSNLPRIIKNFEENGLIPFYLFYDTSFNSHCYDNKCPILLSSFDYFRDLFLIQFWIFSSLFFSYIVGWIEQNWRLSTKGTLKNEYNVAQNFCHITNIMMLFVILPIFIYRRTNLPIIASFLTMTFDIISALKIWSFAHVLNTMRTKKVDLIMCDKSQDENNLDDKECLYNSEKYKTQLNFRHFIYFILAPTLCFQYQYPRRPRRIRWRFVLRRIFEIFFCFSFGFLILTQHIAPVSLFGYKTILQRFDFALLRLILRLSVPSITTWLLWSYGFFHSFLNLMAELLRFGDRNFYQDQWNSESMAEFWRRQNLPVHFWAIRHIYKPLKSYGLKPYLISFIIFSLSALLHEIIIMSSLHMITIPYGFIGMFAQAPIIFVEKTIASLFHINENWSNVLFQIFLCIFGQPVIALLYANDYISEHGGAIDTQIAF